MGLFNHRLGKVYVLEVFCFIFHASKRMRQKAIKRLFAPRRIAKVTGNIMRNVGLRWKRPDLFL